MPRICRVQLQRQREDRREHDRDEEGRGQKQFPAGDASPVRWRMQQPASQKRKRHRLVRAKGRGAKQVPQNIRKRTDNGDRQQRFGRSNGGQHDQGDKTQAYGQREHVVPLQRADREDRQRG